MFQYPKISMSIYIYQAVALGQSGNIYPSIDFLYPPGVTLTGNPFDLASPLLALRGGRGARDPKYKSFNYGYFKIKKTLFWNSFRDLF